MGFITGFTGGVTLTLGLAYLTVYSHERNRHAQALYLRSQHQLLNSLVDPKPPQLPSRAELLRQSRGTFTEIAKDRWNDEVENAVRWVQTTDWNGVREGMEGAIARLLGLGLQKPREKVEEAEKQVGPNVRAVDRSKAAAKSGAEQAAAGANRAAVAAIAGAQRASGAVKSGLEMAAITTREGLDKGVVDTKAGIDNAVTSIRGAVDRGIDRGHEMADKARTEAYSTGAGTVDAARGALRNVVSKGIEKGKEAIAKAQETMGLATENAESMSQGESSGMQESDVERAMRERYETPKGFDRSAEEVLEERYKPIEQRDNTILRGV